MDLGLAGRLAIVTGASKGIGWATAERLAEEGCDVHLVARSEAALEARVAELRQRFGINATFSALDLGLSASVADLQKAIPCPDILVNNAGAIPAGTIDRVDEATWRHAWELKVFGYINLCRAYNTAMRDAGRGVIINVIGAGGERPTADYAAGAGGNAALMGLTKAMGGASPRYGVRIVGINPGLIVTDRLVSGLSARAEERLGDASRWEELLDPKYPPGKPEHIADMVAFLASDRSANTTGTIVTIDGGRCAR